MNVLSQTTRAPAQVGGARVVVDVGPRFVGVQVVVVARSVVGAGEVWVISSYNRRSFDSRYVGAIPVAQRAALRLAATEATVRATQAVDLMYDAGGGTSIYATSPLQRCFRDVHVVTQHAMVASSTYELTGRLLLGLDTDSAML